MPCYALLCLAMPCYALLCVASVAGVRPIQSALMPASLISFAHLAESSRISATVLQPKPPWHTDLPG